MKRFWKNVKVASAGDGFAITLDGREVKTPSRNTLFLPNEEMARAIAAEWSDCGEELDPADMPITGFANAAIDRVATERQAFVEAVAAFGESDLFCYRADSPQELVDRQEESWGKWLRWAQGRYLLNFNVISGIVHQPQPEPTLVRLREAVNDLNNFQLAAALKITHLSGSLVTLLILVEGEATAEAIWPDLILDELWQEEQWGADSFALKNRHDREAEFREAAVFLDLSKSQS